MTTHVLKPPCLLYADGAEITPTRGVWRAGTHKFLIGATITKWTIASVTRNLTIEMCKLADMIYKIGNSSGMRITSKAIPPFSRIGGNQGLKEITDYFAEKKDYEIIFIVVPNKGSRFSLVKQAAELNIGCLTHCIKEDAIVNLTPKIVTNILLKVNMKLNGTNHSIAAVSCPTILRKPSMIMGAFINHPFPDNKNFPCVAAVVASYDTEASKYHTCWRLQPPKSHIIKNISEITKQQLMFFYKKNGCKPENIVIFRSGLPEAQLRVVMSQEVYRIKKACKDMQEKGFEPKITYFVIQKRHCTRLVFVHSNNPQDNSVPVGTCVDAHITIPAREFYLVSHASTDKTVKPVKYYIMYNKTSMEKIDIEKLTYYLCHMIADSNSCLNNPAPTYYARLAADRAKLYIKNNVFNLENLQKDQKKYQINKKIAEENPMFFL